MKKIVFGVAQESDSKVPMGELAAALFKRYAEAGNGRRDFSSIFKYYNIE
jgi:3-hydroxyisobutyrate dehydrogenase-like beta-hydroxyacid dehydrogenase